MSDNGEHWKKWVSYEWTPIPEMPLFVAGSNFAADGFDDLEPTEEEIEALIEELDGCCCQCGMPLFQDWWDENQEVIEEDFEGLDYTQKLLIKDWLSQAYSAGRVE